MVELPALHQQLAKAKTPHDKSSVQAQIDATDERIDRLVYDLYGLTDEEIRIVEEGTGKCGALAKLAPLRKPCASQLTKSLTNSDTRLNRRSQAIGSDAVDKMHGPAAFAAVDREGDFRVDWSVFDGISENNIFGTEMRNSQDVAVHK